MDIVFGTHNLGDFENLLKKRIDTNKKVYAFYIVDAECEYTKDLSKESFARQLELETIQPDDAEKEKISEAFYGYTTWQAIAEKLPQIVFKSKKDIK